MMLSEFSRDVAYALRSSTRTPSLTAIIILTLALGIGATTAIFSVVNAVLLRPLPYAAPERVVQIIENVPAEETPNGIAVRRTGMNLDDFDWWRNETQTLSHMAVATQDVRTFVTPEGTVRLSGASVSPALFPLRGVAPLLGRGLAAEEERADAGVVVLSESTWQRFFAADPGVLGRMMLLDGEPLTIVGVMPAAFGAQDFWTPYAVTSAPGRIQFARVSSRLRDGISIEAATAEANVLGARLRGTESAPGAPARFEVVGELDQLTERVAPALRVLVLAAAAVLMIVCTNVANLLLARAATRQNDIATRRSLGATRWRIARQVLTESLVLAAFGGAGGILLAYGGVALLKTAAVIDLPSRFQSGGATILPRLDEVAVDPAALAVVAVLAAVSGLMFGAVPALRLARLEVAPGARAATEGSESRRSGRVLATAQIAFALTLLVAASLLLNSFLKLAAVDPGFHGDNVLTVDLVPPESYGPPQRIETAGTIVERLRSNPLVTAAGFTSSPPLSRRILIGYAFIPPGWTLEDLNEIENALPPDERTQLRLASPDYLRALGARLLHGRWVDERNAAAGTLEVLVTRSYVRRHFREENPVGVTLESPFAPATIVGVLDDLHMRALDAAPESIVFADPAQLLAAELAVRPDAVRAGATFLRTLWTDGSIAFAVRTRGAPLAFAAEVQAIVHDVDAALVVDNAMPMDDVLSGLTTRPRFYALLLGIFGAVAAAIAVIGVYGVLAYSVGRRTREIGVRMALGAEGAGVRRLVMREGVLMIAIGVGLGLAGAAAATRYLEGMLFGLGTLDAATYGAAAAGFAAVALLASYLPARHATRIDPLAALRHE